MPNAVRTIVLAISQYLIMHYMYTRAVLKNNVNDRE